MVYGRSFKLPVKLYVINHHATGMWKNVWIFFSALFVPTASCSPHPHLLPVSTLNPRKGRQCAGGEAARQDPPASHPRSSTSAASAVRPRSLCSYPRPPARASRSPTLRFRLHRVLRRSLRVGRLRG